MIEFGKTLREAREAKGLTISQVADRTHMLTQMVENLENENFSRIAAPIYGRGFVKLYCDAVGIDPKPLIAEFMDIFNGNRAPTIKMRGGSAAPAHGRVGDVAPAPEPKPEPEPEPDPVPAVEPKPEPDPVPADEPEPDPVPAAEPEPEHAASGIPQVAEISFALEQQTIRTTKPEPAPRPEPAGEPERAPEPAVGADEPDEAPRTPSRYAAPMPVEEDRRWPGISIPPAVWRILALAAAAVLLLWLILLGVRALYHATMDAPTPAQNEVPEPSAPGGPATEPERRTPEEKAPGVPDAAAAKPPRKPMDVPPLYID